MEQDYSNLLTADAKSKKYSIVIPVYRSEAIISLTCERIQEVMDRYGLEWELILVNDCSPDDSWNVIKKLSKDNCRITAIDLLKNVGQHSANMCGFTYVNGDYVITMDDDLQNPPEELPLLIAKINEGYEFVSATFSEKKSTGYRKIGSKLIQIINRRIFNTPKDFVHTNFRIASNEVITRVTNYQTFYPYTSGLFAMFSRNIANVEVAHHERHSGESNYNLMKLVMLALNIVMNYSSWPIKIISLVGGTISIVGFLVSVIALIYGLVVGNTSPGWLSLVMILSFYNSLLFLILAFLGELINRTLQKVTIDKKYHVRNISP